MKIKIYTKDRFGNKYVLPFDSKTEAQDHLARTLKLNRPDRNSIYKVKWGEEGRLNEATISDWGAAVEFLKTL